MPAMVTEGEGLRLRVFVHEALRRRNKPVFMTIVERARREGVAGAVVFRGIEGFGVHHHLHTTRLLDVSDDLPMIVEIVDRVEAIQRFLPFLSEMVSHGAIHEPHLFRLSNDLPIVVELVDTKEKVDEFLSVLDGMVREGMITISDVEIITYGKK